MRTWLKKYKRLFLVVSGLCIYCVLLAQTKRGTPLSEGGDFITFVHQGVELEVCPCCSGVWFDAGELPRVAQRRDIDPQEFAVENLLLLPDECLNENPRECPVCRTIMAKKTVSRHPLLVVDVCPCGEGVWLDGPEVALVNDSLFGADEAGAPATIYAGLPESRSVVYDLHDFAGRMKK